MNTSTDWRLGDLAILRAGLDWWASIEPHLEQQSGGCLLWTGVRSGHGYAMAKLPADVLPRDRSPFVVVHRAALVLSLGRPLGEGLVAGHVCHDDAFAAGLCVSTLAQPCQHRRCVNVEHLAEQTQRENVRRGGALFLSQLKDAEAVARTRKSLERRASRVGAR